MANARFAARPLAVLLALAAACGGTSEQQTPNPYAGPPPLGAAIQASDGTRVGATEWRWIPFPDSVCQDASAGGGTSPTGIAVSFGTTSDLVVYLQGGGACWDYYSCAGGAASSGPFDATQFQGVYTTYFNSWVRRANLPSALAGANIVFVPYCTGDVHAGNQVTTYQSILGGSITWHHVGHANLLAFLKRLGATFPNPGKLVVAGSSAGGFGSLANYPAFRWYWPNAKSYLVDDSGPPLIGSAIPDASRSAWYASWNIGASLDPFCPGCRTDMSQGLVNLARLYPNDRIALLSTVQDLTIREFFGTPTTTFPYWQPMAATDFETYLRALGTSVMAATSNEKYFFVLGEGHALLLDPASTSYTGLTAWLESMLTDNASWASTAP